MNFLEKELKLKKYGHVGATEVEDGGSHTDMCGRDIGEGESWCS